VHTRENRINHVADSMVHFFTVNYLYHSIVRPFLSTLKCCIQADNMRQTWYDPLMGRYCPDTLQNGRLIFLNASSDTMTEICRSMSPWTRAIMRWSTLSVISSSIPSKAPRYYAVRTISPKPVYYAINRATR